MAFQFGHKRPTHWHSVDWRKRPSTAKGLTQSYNVGYLGEEVETVQSAMSAVYFDQKGIVLGSYFKRFTLNLNLDYQPTTTWLKSSTSAKYAYQNANNPFGKPVPSTN
jgi:hypothetical protein